MRRPLYRPTGFLVRLSVVALLLIGLIASLVAPRAGTAQEGTPDAGTAAPLIDVVLDPVPASPSFFRLIRITMEPGSSIPMRSHPGPKIDRVESGTLTAVVRDPDTGATLAADGGDQADVAPGEDLSIIAGDVLVLPIDTFYAFRNDGSEPVVLLSTIMLPAGHQRPPGITYADGEPPSDAYAGVTNQILGDGVATALPASPGRYVVDQVEITPAAPLAASSDVTLLSDQINGLGITIDSGRVQVSRTVSPGPQRDSEPGTSFTLINGDGVFFPDGHAEIAAPEGTVTFLRATLTGGELVDSGASTGQDGTPVATGPGTITITSVPATQATAGTDATPLPQSSRPSRAVETPAPTAESTSEPSLSPTDEAEATIEPTGDSGDGGDASYPLGATVATNDIAVNIRAEPSADAELVTSADAAGTRFVVIGEPVTTEGLTWIPVQSLDDPSISGWIVADFLDPV